MDPVAFVAGAAALVVDGLVVAAGCPVADVAPVTEVAPDWPGCGAGAFVPLVVVDVAAAGA